MGNAKTHIDDDLLTKFILGEADFSEKELVAGWINESDGNRDYFESFSSAWQNCTTEERQRPDPDAAWQKMERQLKPSVLKSFIPYFGAAAAILLIAYFIFVPETYNVTKFAASGKPGKEILPDGSEIMLGNSASLKYFFDTKNNARTAKLKGKAFFHVKKDTAQKFIVETAYGRVEVLGTQFNVNVVKNEGVYVDVLSGIVGLSKKGTNTLVLRKGESGFIPATDGYQIQESLQAPAVFFNINKTLTFNNMPLTDVFANLERCYSVKINVGNRVDTGLLFTSRFSDNNIEEILNVITQTHGLKYKKLNKGNYFIFEE